ncbi:MAG TPA: DUF4386 domain-containing protein [Gemmatimonadaceae bacterium]|jgi:hypothetical protein|nr:DUF4386 domain-containing protein [Gemmatimonadaceae bacterium]
MQPVVEASPHPTPRTIGVVYLLYFLTAVAGALLMKGLVVPTDAVVTAQNLLAHESLYRAGWEVGLVANAFYIAVTALFYGLLAPVNRSMAVMMAFFSLVGCIVQIFGGMLQIAPFTIMGDTQMAGAFTVAQLQSAVLLSFKLYPLVFHISLVLFALFDFLLGYLIYESTFLPRFLGVWFMIAGVVGLIFLWPPLGTALRFVIIPIGGIAEIVLMLWLIVKGVDVSRWREKAGAPL